MATASWMSPSPTAKYGMGFASPSATRDDTPLAQVAGPAPAAKGTTQLLHPNNPMFWVGALLLGAFGLAAVSTSVRVGPVKVSGSLGG
ncbi:hypothetical protein AB0K51_12415 [Kitasatospora sp. NPDC049285]|uniref:hypothetical protein n=1 Tax=Kitasatospora sp. NPDC049285 TaxID=3157096 RepID=UPI00343A916C